MGIPLLNSNCCVQKLLELTQAVPTNCKQVVGALPATVKAVSPPPVTGSSGRLRARELWKSKFSVKSSLTFQSAFNPSERRSFFCSRCC